MNIRYYPDPCLTAKNRRISYDEEGLAEKVEAMYKLMREKNGIGLAAPQVGWNVKLFILGIRDPGTGILVRKVLLNPEVRGFGDEELMEEGCLSFPGIAARIKRHTRVEVHYDGMDGRLYHAHFDGLWAHAVQHENDHLNGILFVDKMTQADRKKNAWILKELEEGQTKKA